MRGHIPALDGLRGVAILLVLAVHFRVPPADNGLDRAVGLALGLGWLGVDLFFVLSGFLITGLLLDAKGGSGYFGRFYMRRVLRIFPAYYLVLAFFLLVSHLPDMGGPLRSDGVTGREWWFWLYLSNVAMTLFGQPETVLGQGVIRTDPLAITWSLAVEEQFYLVWPVVVLLCSRQRLLSVCAVLLVLAPMIRGALLVGGVGAGFGLFGPYVLMPARMDSFAVGAGVALLARQPAVLSVLARCARMVAPLAGAFLLVIAVRRGPSFASGPMETAGFSIAAIGFGSLLVLALVNQRVSRWLEWPVLRAFGRYSYAIYLIHIPLARLIFPWLFPPLSPPPIVLGSHLVLQVVVWAVLLPAALLAGWLSWQLIERHFLALKRYFPYGSPRQETGAMAATSMGRGAAAPALSAQP